MNISRQWADRLKIWSEQFEKHYVMRHSALEVSFFTTMEHLPFERAKRMAFQPAPVGMKWGQKWEYGWFHASFVVPEELAGKRLVLFLRVGEEMLVWLNGVESGAIDRKHSHITLTRNANAGDVFEIYAGATCGDHQPIFVPDANNIIVDTIKPSDTAENALLVRAYEAMGMQTESRLRLHDRNVRICETDMLEENVRERSRDEVISFGAFEIKTFLLYLQD